MAGRLDCNYVVDDDEEEDIDASTRWDRDALRMNLLMAKTGWQKRYQIIFFFLWVSWEILRLWSADVSDGHGIRRLFRLTVLSIGMVDLEIRLVVN